MSLLDFYRADDLPGFISEWRRQNPHKSGAVQAWFTLSLRAGAYDIAEDVLGDDEEEDP